MHLPVVFERVQDTLARQRNGAARAATTPKIVTVVDKKATEAAGNAAKGLEDYARQKQYDSIPKNQLYEPLPDPQLTPITDKYSPSVVQIVNNRTGKKSFMRIPEANFASVKRNIDGTSNGVAGIRGDDGDVLHITARSPEDMTARGFEDGGVYQASEQARQATADARTAQVRNAPKVTISDGKTVNPDGSNEVANLNTAYQAAEDAKQPGRIPQEVTNSGSINGEFQRAITDKDAPLINYLKQVEKNSNQKGLVDQFYLDSGLQRRANSIANAQVMDSADIKKAFGGLKGADKAEFDSYAAARNELANARNGLPTSQPVETLNSIVANLDQNMVSVSHH
jgi:hypothetical protein